MYYARVHSHNKYGYSKQASLSTPVQQSPKTSPGKPLNVAIIPAAASDTSLTVMFEEPLDNGGAPVSGYKIIWDMIGNEAMSAGASEVLYSEHEVQSITVNAGRLYIILLLIHLIA